MIAIFLAVLLQDPYAAQLDRTIDYLDKNWDPGCHLVSSLFAGVAFMLDGREPYKANVDKAIRRAIEGTRATEQTHNCMNWYVAYSGLFLAIAYKRDPKPEIKEALLKFVAYAEEHMEPTGGWCHAKGFAAKNDYVKNLGATDLAMVTSTMLSAFLIMKASGLEVPQPTIDRTIKNLTTLWKGDGMGLAYGTGNTSRDRAMSRTAMAYIGCHAAQVMTPPWVAGASKALTGKMGIMENGHGPGAIHFFAVSLAMHLMGRYPAFAAHWLPKIAKTQAADGTVDMLHDAGKNWEKNWDSKKIGSAAVFAIMILLNQKRELFPRASPKPAKSPFSNKK